MEPRHGLWKNFFESQPCYIAFGLLWTKVLRGGTSCVLLMRSIVLLHTRMVLLHTTPSLAFLVAMP